MLIVTGATGQLGRLVVSHLLAHVPASRIGVSVRDSTKATDLAELGVRVRKADYGDPDSLIAAFEGAERILMVSSNAAATGGDTLEQHRTAIDAARKAGATRILYTSQMSASPSSHFPPGRDHAATERMLAESGLAWTALRHGFHAASALMMNRQGFEAGRIVAPEDGKVAWTTHDDLAAADAALLAGVAVIDGPTPPLTAGETLDLIDLAALASDILGRPILRDYVTDDEMRERAVARGVPEMVVRILMGYYAAARAGEFAPLNGTLARLIGRAPQTMRSFLRENLPQ